MRGEASLGTLARQREESERGECSRTLLAFPRGVRRPPDRWDDVVPVGGQGLVLRIVLELETQRRENGPFCGANTRAASSNATDASHKTPSSRPAKPPTSTASSAR